MCGQWALAAARASLGSARAPVRDERGPRALQPSFAMAAGRGMVAARGAACAPAAATAQTATAKLDGGKAEKRPPAHQTVVLSPLIRQASAQEVQPGSPASRSAMSRGASTRVCVVSLEAKSPERLPVGDGAAVLAVPVATVDLTL